MPRNVLAEEDGMQADGPKASLIQQNHHQTDKQRQITKYLVIFSTTNCNFSTSIR
jgi:hypothetical protein